MAGNRAVIGFGGALRNRDGIGDFASQRLRTVAGTSPAPFDTSLGLQRQPQTAAAADVPRVIDRLVGHT